MRVISRAEWKGPFVHTAWPLGGYLLGLAPRAAVPTLIVFFLAQPKMSWHSLLTSQYSR